MSFHIITQSRYSSSRLPAKIFLNFDNENFFTFFLKNLKSIGITKLIVASPKDQYSDIIAYHCKKIKVPVFFYEGDVNNVLARYYFCAKKFKSKNIIRITSDCPFINPYMILEMIDYYKKKKLNFLTNNKPRKIPHGFDCEIFSFKLLKKAFNFAKNKYDLEHVTPWFYKNCFEKKNYHPIFNQDFSKIRLTLDTPNDYLRFIKLQKKLKKISSTKNYKYILKNLNKI